MLNDYLIQLESAKLRYQNFYASTQRKLMEAEQKEMAPISEKMKAAIDEIAADKGFDYVLDYTCPLNPELPKAKANWVKQVLLEGGF